MSVYVVRAFVQLRGVLAADSELARKVAKLQRGHETHESVLVGVMKTIHELKSVPETRAIGFFELQEKKKGPSSDDV